MVPTTTLNRFIQSQEQQHRIREGEIPSGELSDLLASVALGVKIVGNLVATSGLKGIGGYTSKVNVQGETVHAIDEEADQIFVDILGSSGHFGLLLSEERDEVIETARGHASAKYVLAFDPVDGSSNLGSNIPVGTIFCIFRKSNGERAADQSDFLQSGRKIVAAGYGLYGSRTSFVYSAGRGVHEFILDPSIGEFMLTNADVRSPDRGSTYSINEGNQITWPSGVRKFVDAVKVSDKAAGTPYSLRYTGSLVADFDRNLKRGGIFMYPPDKKHLQGKLRLLYECFPLAFLAEQAGSRAFNGEIDILDMVPEHVHQRCPLYVGTKHEVDWLQKLHG